MLTSEQIANWREMLSLSLGPYAHIMSDAEIQRIRDRMQAEVGDHSADDKSKEGGKDAD